MTVRHHSIPLLEEQHSSASWLHDLILGGQDGLVNVLGIVLGVSAAGGQTHIIIAASLAAAFAEAVSMGAVSYTSTLAQKDHYQKEMERENFEIEHFPERETEEIRQVYERKGFTGKLLEEIVKKITADKDVWLKVMMAEELGLQPVETASIIKSSVIVGVAAILGSLIPLSPFFLLSRGIAEIFALTISAVALFLVGVYEAKTYVGNPFKNGVQMIIIGLGAAFAGYFIGRLFNMQ